MTGTHIVLLALGGLIALVWLALIAQALHRGRQLAKAEIDRDASRQGPSAVRWGRYMARSGDKRLRQRLTGVTMALLVWLIAYAFLAT